MFLVSHVQHRLDIRECGLVALPEEIRTLRNLRRLHAENNELAVVPRWLEELPLRCLCLTNNKLEVFPFLHLPGLAGLYLYGNQLTRLPCVVRHYPLNQ